MNEPAGEVEAFAPEHLDGCARLYAATFSENPWNEGWTPETARERLLQVIGAPGFHGLVVVRDEEVVGLALGYRRRRPEGDFFLLDEMCVSSTLGRIGLGHMLLTRLRRDLASQGVGRVVLLTGRNGPARAFYEKNGFRENFDWVLMVADETVRPA